MNQQQSIPQLASHDILLGIYVITYNRANSLKQTLEYINNSKLRDFPITVLNNCSTDNTIEVAELFIGKIPDFKIISNKFNIGLGANFLKTFDLSNYKYTWVLCDDDYISPLNMDDVIEIIQQGEIDLIHVGAHAQRMWPFGGQTLTPKQLLDQGYPYFKFSSFIPCNIFKTESFVRKFMVQAYDNIINVYPHMPFLFYLYKCDVSLYISKNPLVVAKPSDSGYSQKNWYSWWMKTSELIKDKSDVRIVFLDQWKDIGVHSEEEGFKYLLKMKALMDDQDYVSYFVSKYLTASDKVKLFQYRLGINPFRQKQSVRDILYWFKENIKKGRLSYKP